mmetsp:Transcript_7191/g.12110  ORF Transcript_7191/g.12110 Transcript_7191/m.12110 type:complete len:311 (-) Transcript_7191:590-1522(-)
MMRVPRYNAIWAVLHPVNGLLLYTVVLMAVRPTDARRKFNPILAIPISTLFGIYNVMKSGCGKGNAVPGILLHLTDQLEPVVTMILALIIGRRARYPISKWGAALLLVVSTVGYIFIDLQTALNVQLSHQLVLCVSKNIPLALAFLYVEWLLTTRCPEVFPTILWWWICLFQIFTTLLPAYFQFDANDFDTSSYSSFLANGIRCYWLGIPNEECGGVPAVHLAGVITAGCMNLAMPVVARHGGAHVLMYVRAVTLPVVAYLFTSPLLVGDQAESLTWNKVCGLASACASLLLWATSDMRSGAPMGKEKFN